MRSQIWITAFLGLLLSTVAVNAAEPTVAELIAAVKSADGPAKLQAIDSLALLGAKAAESIPALTEALQSTDAAVRAHAAQALGAMGEAAKPAVPDLIKLTSDPDPAVRREALEAMGWIHPEPKMSLPLLIKLIESSDPESRHAAISTLTDQGKVAVPFLVESLKNEKAAYWACLVLGHMGSDAQEAVPALTKLLDDKHPEVRREAILAIAEIGGNDAVQATPQIVKALDDPHTKTAAIFALALLGKAPEEADAAIRKEIGSDDPVLSVVSLWALARLHPDDKKFLAEATDKLCAALKSQEPRARKAAARALGSLKPGPEIMIPAMEKNFKNASMEIVHDGMDALASMGPIAVPQLIDALRYEPLRPCVINLLGRQGAAAKSATNTLVKLLDDPNPAVEYESVIALGAIGPDAKEAAPELLQRFDAAVKQGGPMAYGLAFALGRIGSPEAVPSLKKAMASSDEALATFSAWALVQIQPKDQATVAKALPMLLRALSHPEAKYRRGALEAIKLMGPLAKSAKSDVEKALKDTDPTVRDMAQEALKAMGE
jgi:HEAT repeat protein